MPLERFLTFPLAPRWGICQCHPVMNTTEQTMKPYYVIRAFRNGLSSTGYSYGAPTRFTTLAAAEQNASDFAADVLPTNPNDYIAVGEGAIRHGLSVGRGRRIAEYSVRGRQIHGQITRRAC